MEIKVVNNIPNAKATVTHCEDGSVVVTLTEKNLVELGSLQPGETLVVGYS